jgi:hypothetical protein
MLGATIKTDISVISDYVTGLQAAPAVCMRSSLLKMRLSINFAKKYQHKQPKDPEIENLM